MNIKNSFLSLLLASLAYIGLSTTVFAIEQQAGDFCYAAWKPIPIENKDNKLPAHPYFIVSAQSSGDFIAVAADEVGGRSSFYLLDHLHFNEGWKKTGEFVEGDVDCLKSMIFGKIFAFGVDKNTNHSVVAVSCDEGKTWSQSDIIDGTAHYDSVAFSCVKSKDSTGKDVYNGIGVATGKDGAIAVTTANISRTQTEGIVWKQTQSPSHAAKKVVYVPTGGTALFPEFSFVLITDPADYRSGFLMTHDCATVAGTTTYSKDGITWSSSPGIFLTASFPNNNYSSQLLIHNGQANLTMDLVNNKDHFSFPCHGLGDLAQAVFLNQMTQLDQNESLFDISDFFVSPAVFVGIGLDIKTQKPISIVSSSTLLSLANHQFRCFTIEDLDQKFIGLARGGLSIVMDSDGNAVKNENGLGYKTEGEDRIVALGSDGTCYFTPTLIKSSQ